MTHDAEQKNSEQRELFGEGFAEMSEKAAAQGWLLIPPDAVLEFHPEKHRALLRTDIAEIEADLREWEWEKDHDCELAP